MIRLIALLIIVNGLLESRVAFSKQPEISLSQIVSRADVVFVGRVEGQSAANDRKGKGVPSVRNEIAVSKVLKGSVRSGPVLVCYVDDQSDPPNLKQQATYIFFVTLGKEKCYEPLNGIRGVARVHDAHVDTRYLKGEPQSRSLEGIVEQIERK